MCLARVDIVDNGRVQDEGLVKDVAYIERTPTGLRVTDLVGKVSELAGRIRSIDFVESVVTIETQGNGAAG